MSAASRFQPANWTVDQVLRRNAESFADRTFIVAEDGSVSYGEALERAGKVANMLSDAGVGRADPVAVMMSNGAAYCDAWLGISMLGAIHVAINTDYLGEFLVHVLNDCGARVLICDDVFLGRLEEIRGKLRHLETVYVSGTDGRSSLRCRSFDGWRRFPETYGGIAPSYQDIGCVMYTSGTTGPSKGVLMPHAHLYLFGLGTVEHMSVDEDDVFYIVLPLFHANGLFMQLYATMIAGARAVIRRRFSASAWLTDIVESRATITNSLGVVAAFVLAQPPTDQDRAHRLRAMGLAPTSEQLVERLRERFGIPEIYGMYGMTEANIPLYTPRGSDKPSSCGRVWSRYFELRIVDPQSDEEMPRGEVGEIVVRPKQPFGFMAGYLNMHEKTVEAWRNLWFHTGDAAFMDADGDVFFVDRIKDCIRRRGENISSYEVERVFSSHEAVREAAAYAVASSIDGAEDEVMVAVVADAEVLRDLADLDRFAAGRLPAFAVPRYYRRVAELPKTPTGKVRKSELRRQGITEDAVDMRRRPV